MGPTDLIHHYGYEAVLVGTFFEGELIMIAAGVAVAAGILSLPLVIGFGMAGIFASDSFCFLIGRLAGQRIQRWFPRVDARLARARRLIEQRGDLLLVFFQFFPGLCTVTPIAFGMTRISLTRFVVLDSVGNVLWTLVFSLGGYLCGTAFGQFAPVSWEGRWIACSLVGCAVLAASWMGWTSLRRPASAAGQI